MKKKITKSNKGEVRVLIAYQGKVMPLSIVGKLSPKTMTLGESTEDGEVGMMVFAILKDARKAISDALSGKGGERTVRWGTKLSVVERVKESHPTRSTPPKRSRHWFHHDCRVSRRTNEGRHRDVEGSVSMARF